MGALLLPGIFTALAYYFGAKHKMIWPIATMGGLWMIILLATLGSNFIVALISLYATYKMLTFSWEKLRHDDEWKWAPPVGPPYDPS